MKFKLEIELGNDAMQTGDDLAQTLHEIADADFASTGKFTGGERRRLRDRNGNTVGKWEVVD